MESFLNLNNKIFRQKSLDTLSSPEQLDQIMQVTKPLGWAGILASFLLIAIALFWGLKGEIQTVVYGQGILLKEGSIYDVVSLGTGQIQTTRVQVDDEVVKGQVIATLFLPDLDHQIKEAGDCLQSLEAEKKMIWSLGDKTTRLKHKTLDNQRQTLEKTIVDGEERLIFLKKELEHEKVFLEKELTTSNRVQESQIRYDKGVQEIMGYKNDLNDISAREMDLSADFQKERFALEFKISQARLRIKALEENHTLQSRIISPHKGRVLEIFKNSGKVIQTGEPMASIEVARGKKEPLSVFVYFPPQEGKKIRHGMTMRIIPSTIKMEEHGYMLGSIRQISRFPASQKGMLRVLQNQDLVTSLSLGGAPIGVTASLLADPATISQYRWSSGVGPETTVESGTLCTASVVVTRQAPIRLVFPYLKKNILGIGEGQEKGQEKDE